MKYRIGDTIYIRHPRPFGAGGILDQIEYLTLQTAREAMLAQAGDLKEIQIERLKRQQETKNG